MKVSLVIPSYNEEKNIKAFYSLCVETFQNQNYDVEYVFVNDGSKDQTINQIQSLIEETDGDIKGIHFSRNFGKEAAMLAGLQYTTGDLVAIIDADLQQHPKYVVEMVNFLENHSAFDVVACYQQERKEGKVLSGFKKFFYKLINCISETKFSMNASDFRTFRRPVVDAIVSMKEYHRFSKGIFSWVGFQTHYMPYEVEMRNSGVSSWSFKKLFNYAKVGVLGFSTKPLTIATYLGLLMTIFSFGYLVLVVFRKIFGSVEIPGYTTIVSLILLIGGIQMMLLGIIGEYLSQVFIQVKNRPHYIVKQVYQKQSEKK